MPEETESKGLKRIRNRAPESIRRLRRIESDKRYKRNPKHKDKDHDEQIDNKE